MQGRRGKRRRRMTHLRAGGVIQSSIALELVVGLVERLYKLCRALAILKWNHLIQFTCVDMTCNHSNRNTCGNYGNYIIAMATSQWCQFNNSFAKRCPNVYCMGQRTVCDVRAINLLIDVCTCNRQQTKPHKDQQKTTVSFPGSQPVLYPLYYKRQN